MLLEVGVLVGLCCGEANFTGIGYSVVEQLLNSELKPNVVGVSRTEGSMSDLAKKFPGRFSYIAGDLLQEETVQAVVKKAIDEYGQLDGVILNAGVLDPVAKVADAKLEDWRKLYEINLLSPLALSAAAIPHLRSTKGRIVFVSSGASVHPYHGWSAYGSSKAALNHLANTIQAEEPDLFAVSIAPGVVDTEMQSDIREKCKFPATGFTTLSVF